MKIEYEEFENVGDLFLYLVSAAPPMKNTMPITKGDTREMSCLLEAIRLWHRL